ncbi:MAG: cytochrome c [Herminiimonas sp.]|nr:cytochrome c [Herminiimonas sp.]
MKTLAARTGRGVVFLAIVMLAACGQRNPVVMRTVQGDPERGFVALKQYACQACHLIPGITGSDVHVGPPLAGVAERKYLAGTLPNTPANMVRWIHDPKRIDPLTAMPKQGMSEADAVDMVAYLYNMKQR